MNTAVNLIRHGGLIVFVAYLKVIYRSRPDFHKKRQQ